MTSGCRTSAAGLAHDLFAMCAERRVAGDAFEQERLRVLEAGEEAGAEEPGGESDHRGVQQSSSQDPEIEGRGDRPPAPPRAATTRPERLFARRSSSAWLRRLRGARAHRPHERDMRRLRVFGGSEPLRQGLPGDSEMLCRERAVAVTDLEHAPDVGELDRVQRRDRGLAVVRCAPDSGRRRGRAQSRGHQLGRQMRRCAADRRRASARRG